jgi:hypothetical protein
MVMAREDDDRVGPPTLGMPTPDSTAGYIYQGAPCFFPFHVARIQVLHYFLDRVRWPRAGVYSSGPR